MSSAVAPFPHSVAPVADAPPALTCHVHKFGGTSLADAACIAALAALVPADARVRPVVVSAMSGTTNALVALADAALALDDWKPAWDALRAYLG